jgi:hypothetical protein
MQIRIWIWFLLLLGREISFDVWVVVRWVNWVGDRTWYFFLEEIRRGEFKFTDMKMKFGREE